MIVAAILVLGGVFFVLSQKGNVSQPSITEVAPTVLQETPPTSDTTVEESATITETTNGFEPATITIKAGEKVTWMNKTGGDISIDSDPHPIHTSYAPLNLGAVKDGASTSLTFDKPGIYNYHDHFDSSRRGKVIVE